MKIDSGTIAAAQVQTDWQTKQSSTSSVAGSAGPIGDRTTLSSDVSTMRSLVSQAMQTSDVRQDKVDALRQSIGNGSYSVDTQSVASAVLANGSE